MDGNYYVLALLSFTQIFMKGQCQLADNTPPTLYLERNWQIPETEPVGSKISQAHGSDAERGELVYGLEPLHFYGSKRPPDKLPFTIDPDTGTVYLNESLKGRGGQDLHLYVTVSDGELVSKAEVYVNILNSTSHHKQPRPPPFLNYPPFNTRLPKPPPMPKNISNYSPSMNLPPPSVLNNPPASIANNPPPLPRPHFQPKPEKKTRPSTQLKPVVPQTEPDDNSLSDDESQLGVDAPKEDGTTTRRTVNENSIEEDLRPIDAAVKSPSEFTATVVPIISVCAVFLVVGIVAMVFRKRIYLGKAKDSKEDMRKESSGAYVLREDPGVTMQDWGRARTFSNRYEPWNGNTNHTQVENQISDTVKNPDKWEFPRHRLKFFNILGEGAFGQVWKCEALDMGGKESGISIVAVKTLKENASEKEKSDLLSELQVMKMLDPHPNVVKLLGCCTEKEPVFLIMEYISRGKLQSYLRSSRAERHYNNMHGPSKSLTSRDLTSFCYQVARGMEFLSSNGIIHRDLAARNILITEDHTCKVADFGFARDVITSHVYERKSEGRLPIRWMAPESLYDNIFSAKSDVWSFGVLIWEIVTLGSTPYPGMSAQEVMKKVRDGYRLDKPEHCRRELYNIMYYCWDKDPKERPSFTECVALLEKLLMTETDYIELERFPDHSYYNMVSLSGEKL